MAAFTASIFFFVISAIFFIWSVVHRLAEPLEPTPFADVGNFFGLAGMITIPIFIGTALLVNWREKRKAPETPKKATQ